MPNAFLSDGNPTDNVALVALVFVPKPAVVRAPAGMVLTKLPATVDLTFNVIVQVPPAGIVAPLNLTPVLPIAKTPPAASVMLLALPQLLVVFVFTSVIPDGKLSINVAPVMVRLLGLSIVRFKELVAPIPTTAGLNPLFICGATTVKFATAEIALEPPLVVRAPTGIVLT